ncbi:MAG: hypothetical protein SPK06_00365 [Kiritimatiellia bacterium]|nr:hypothetical protein [Kiritimatiellia bacterium]
MAKLAFICGADDYLLESAAKRFIEARRKEQPELEVVRIDGLVSNSAEAAAAAGRTVAAMAEQDLFGAPHLIWLKDASFLTGGTAPKNVLDSELTKKSVAKLAESIKGGALAERDSLLITAQRCLKTSLFWKACAAAGEVQVFDVGGKPREREKAMLALLPELCREVGFDLPKGLHAAFLQKVGTDARTLVSELEKLRLYCTGREPKAADIEEICSSYAQAEFWDVKDAVGERNVPKLLSTLHLLSGQKNIGIPIANSVFNLLEELILVQEALANGWLRGGSWSGNLPPGVQEALGANGLLSRNSWLLKRLVEQAAHYTAGELQWARHYAMEMRQALVSSGGGDEAFIIQTGLLKIIGTPVRR